MPTLLSKSSAAATLALAVLASTMGLPVTVSAQNTAAAPMVRIRGTVVYADARSVIVKDRSGEVVSLARAPDMPIAEVYRIKLSDIKQGSFIGTAATPQADGTQKALEVVVFP